jgi:hypothetical protein
MSGERKRVKLYDVYKVVFGVKRVYAGPFVAEGPDRVLINMPKLPRGQRYAPPEEVKDPNRIIWYIEECKRRSIICTQEGKQETAGLCQIAAQDLTNGLAELLGVAV